MLVERPLGAAGRLDVELEAVVQQARVDARRGHVARVHHEVAVGDVLHAGVGRGEHVAVHLRDPRRVLAVAVRVARVVPRLGVVAHHVGVVVPQRRHALEVRAVVDHEAAALRAQVALGRLDVPLAQVVVRAQVAELGAHRPPRPRAQLQRQQRLPQHHVGVGDDDVVGRHGRIGVPQPVVHAARLVVRRVHVAARVAREVGVHVRLHVGRAERHAAGRAVRPQPLAVAREQARQPAGLADEAVGVRHAQALPVEVGRALGAEDGVHRRRRRRLVGRICWWCHWGG